MWYQSEERKIMRERIGIAIARFWEGKKELYTISPILNENIEIL